ncbi:MAG: SCO family protein, partial [Pedobacter sp.]
MSKKTIFYLSFAAITVLGFYLLLSAMIPGFNDKKPNPVSEVKPFRFYTQDGKDFTQADVKGKVYVAEYFFTTCPGICPVMNNNLRTVYDHFKGRENFLILSHTCNPDRDSVSVIKQYA